MDERSIFMTALEQEIGAKRAAFLDEACANDPALRQRVEALLQSHAEAGTFLGTPVVERWAEQLRASPGKAEGASDEPPSDDLSLEFLTPSDKPGSLGRLGHYEIQEIIGRGGMGIVLRAFDEKLHRVVAIKVMAPQLATSAAARRRFSREAQAAAAVSHDHVVTIHAVEEAGGLPYLAMQYVSGMSLQERLDKRGPLELREIVRIGMQTAVGLAAAHAQGLIHRDIKPANILLENGVERVKITDFGLARAVADASMTQAGMVAGTPQYMSPEQARGETLDQRSDLFSLGSVLYAMCTSRPPFQAETTVATARLVCEDTPRPIRELNTDIPEWLTKIIDRLLAKQPAKRFQSAAEVAELLGQHLAQLQNPGLPKSEASVVSHSALRTPHSAFGRRWALAAAVLLCLGIGLAEATGTTQLAETVVRIFIPGGTLVVETDDPAVKVTIEGDGGLMITGAGLEEIRLRPGSYKVQADKDGKPVPLEKELVSVARGGREVIKVKLESAPVAAKSAAPAQGAFVLVNSAAERKYDTLLEAVQGASDGDTIEIRGNGPFVSGPITIRRNALTIRAAAGFRPVLKLSSERVGRGLPLIATNYALMLEGLELHRAPGEGGDHNRVLQINGGVLRAANCRFRSSIWTQRIPGCVFLNCEFLSDEAGFLGHFSPGARFIHENCLHRTGGASLYLSSSGNASDEVSIQIRRSTFWSRRVSVWWSVKSAISVASDRPQGSKPIRLDVSRCIFDTPSVLGFEQHKDFVDKAGAHAPPEAEALLLRLIQWRGERNVLPAGSTSVVWGIEGKKQNTHGPKRLEEWQQFWGAAEADPLEGRLRFQGGDLLTRTEASVDELTPDDFRLLPDSPGYRAGPDGKDLGADLELVGPGPAYERWKKTPEYQEWLKGTLQLRAEVPKPETKAFVLLGGNGIEDRKFETLAEAVQSASDGDTIEIRGSGPFLSQPVSIHRIALTIRAGESFRPVIKVNPEALQQDVSLLTTNAALVLEGLELHRAVSASTAPLRAANCRFRAPISVNKSPVCVFLNCELLADDATVAMSYRPGARVIIENCLHRTKRQSIVFTWDDAAVQHVSIQIKGSTFVSRYSSLWLPLQGPLSVTTDRPEASFRLEVSGSLFDAETVLGFWQDQKFLDQSAELGPAEAEATLRRLLQWRGERNVFVAGTTSVDWYSGPKKKLPPHGPKSLEEWKQFWGTGESDSLEGFPRFQGGDLLARTDAALDQLTPADFRLRPDSPGYRAGPDGKDLGADVDLVGPGPAYERWKTTPEYQQWLKETGQTK